MDVDKLYLLSIRSLMVMLDHNFTITKFSQCCLPTIETTTGVKNVMSGILIQSDYGKQVCLLLVIVVWI